VSNACDASNWGIWLNNNGGSGAPNDNAILGNVVTASLNNGIQLNSVTDCVIADNSIRRNGSHGMQIGKASAVSIEGNVVTANAQTGILLQDTSDSVCSGNVLTNNGQNTSSNNFKSGLVLYQNSSSCANNVVTGNRCFDNQGSKTQTYGISILGSVTNTVLSGNLLDGNGSGKGALNMSSQAVGQTFGVPYKRFSGSVSNGQVAIPHGLPYTPTAVSITMTSNGNVYKSAAQDGTNIYLRADGPNRTAEVLVG